MALTKKQEWLAKLQDLILKGLETVCTHYPIFYGSYDWHSAVHAHWAVFKIGIAITSLINSILPKIQISPRNRYQTCASASFKGFQPIYTNSIKKRLIVV
jgi:hypothetical protein